MEAFKVDCMSGGKIGPIKSELSAEMYSTWKYVVKVSDH